MELLNLVKIVAKEELTQDQFRKLDFQYPECYCDSRTVVYGDNDVVLNIYTHVVTGESFPSRIANSLFDKGVGQTVYVYSIKTKGCSEEDSCLNIEDALLCFFYKIYSIEH